MSSDFQAKPRHLDDRNIRKMVVTKVMKACCLKKESQLQIKYFKEKLVLLTK